MTFPSVEGGRRWRQAAGATAAAAMGSFRQWWRRVAAAVKDRRSVLLARGDPRDEPRRAVGGLPERRAGVPVGADLAVAGAAHRVGARAARTADAVLGRGAQGPDARARHAPPLRRLAARAPPASGASPSSSPTSATARHRGASHPPSPRSSAPTSASSTTAPSSRRKKTSPATATTTASPASRE